MIEKIIALIPLHLCANQDWGIMIYKLPVIRKNVLLFEEKSEEGFSFMVKS
jgi:hypothetical protein